MKEYEIINQKEEHRWDLYAESPTYYHKILNGKMTEKTFWLVEDGIRHLDFSLLNKETVFMDLGCGIGRIVHRIAPHVKEYHGVDFSIKMIEKAKKLFKNYENAFFIKNNGFDLSMFEDNSVDIIFSCLLFFHIRKENIQRYFEEAQRILKPGGMFFACHLPKHKQYMSPMVEKEIDELSKAFDVIKKIDGVTHYFNLVCKKK